MPHFSKWVIAFTRNVSSTALKSVSYCETLTFRNGWWGFCKCSSLALKSEWNDECLTFKTGRCLFQNSLPLLWKVSETTNGPLLKMCEAFFRNSLPSLWNVCETANAQVLKEVHIFSWRKYLPISAWEEENFFSNHVKSNIWYVVPTSTQESVTLEQSAPLVFLGGKRSTFSTLHLQWYRKFQFTYWYLYT